RAAALRYSCGMSSPPPAVHVGSEDAIRSVVGVAVEWLLIASCRRLGSASGRSGERVAAGSATASSAGVTMGSEQAVTASSSRPVIRVYDDMENSPRLVGQAPGFMAFLPVHRNEC